MRSHLTSYLAAVLVSGLMLVVGGCFTGVESTPRISAADVRHRDAAVVAPEAVFLDSVKPLPPAQWRPGRRLRVANDRIALIFTSASDSPDGLTGSDLIFDGFTPAVSLTGTDVSEARFRSADGRRFFYRIPGVDAARLDTIHELEVPFTVDLDIVSRLDSIMRGRRFFVRTPMWYDAATAQQRAGLRHVEVRVDSVIPGDENFPAAVCFSLVDPARAASVPAGNMLLMNIGHARKATRNFDVLFSFSDPRRRYPEIKDDVWELIIHSKVREGMSRDECRLALGAPPSLERIPTQAGMAERWRYSDGVYLIFEDGYLTRFRL